MLEFLLELWSKTLLENNPLEGPIPYVGTVFFKGGGSKIFSTFIVIWLSDLIFRAIYDEFINEGLIKPLSVPVEGLKSKDVKDFITSSGGMSTLVKHFFKKSGVQVDFNHSVNKIEVTNDKKLVFGLQVIFIFFYRERRVVVV